MKKNTIIDGIAASEHLDSSGESLSIEGMDISSLGGPDSILNWEHGSKDRPSQVVGKVTFAKKIMEKSGAKTKREKYFWNKIKKPFVYIKAELFDGIGHSGAQDVAAMLRYKNKDKGEESRLVVGFSIEGGKMDKKGMVVTKSIARDVAITVKPCNKVCDAELIEDNDDDDFLYKNQDFDCEILEKGSVKVNTSAYRDLIMSDIKKSTVGNTTKRIFSSGEEPETLRTGDKILHNKTGSMRTGKDIYNDPKTWENPEKKKPYGTENSMRKALIAGMMAGSPDSKTGGDALAAEELMPEMQNVSVPSKKKEKKLKKNEDDGEEIFLQHYSNKQGLKSIDPNHMGSGVDKRTKGRSTDHKFSFYYPHNYENPEHQVKSNAKSKYTVKVPKGHKIYDSSVHGSDMINQAKAKNQGIFTMDHFLGTLKENGYHGFKSNPNGIKMVGMFHDLPTHSEEDANAPVKLQKMSQPVFSNPEIGSEIDLRSDVKMINPDKQFNKRIKPKENEGQASKFPRETISSAALENKKLQNKYVQGEKEVSGAKSIDDFTPKARREVEDYKQNYNNVVDPNTQKGVNVQDPNYKVNEAYEYKQKNDENKFPSTRHHEGTHKFFSSVAQKMGQETSANLMNHLMDNFFDKEDMKSINSNLSNYYDKDDPHLKEESLTHVLDLIHDKDKRNSFHEKHSFMNSGNHSPGKAEKLDRERMNRLKRGYQNAVKFVNGLNSSQIKQFGSKNKAKG